MIFMLFQVGMANEVFQMAEEECIRISADDKHKVPVGTLAVSRYFSIRRFFPVDDSPNFYDHDWVSKNSKVVPSGYLVMRTPNNVRRY